MIPLETLNAYLALGRPLFPCRHVPTPELKPDGKPVGKAKQPMIPNGFHGASLDPSQVEAWHKQWPDAVWSTPTSWDYAVVDIDPRHGGDATWADLIGKHGPIPSCPTVATGGGGTHYVMRFPVGTRKGKIGEGIDLQADGGYVILPPSRVLIPEHADAYRWTAKLSTTPIPDAPEWLVALAKGEGVPPAATRPGASGSPITLDPANPFAGAVVPHTLQSHPGARRKADGGEGQHDTYVRLVGAELRRGVDPEQVRQWAEAWAGRCTPPYGEWEGQYAGILRSAYRKGEIGLQAGEGDTLTSPPTGSPQQGSKQVSNSPTGGEGGGDTYLLTCLLPEPTPDAEPRTDPNSPTPPPPCKPIIPSGITEYRDDSLFPPAEPDHKGIAESDTLHPDAYHGIIGDILRAVEPETEAHPGGVLVALLALVGNAVGCGAWVTVGGRRHHPALYAAIVSASGAGKGDAYAVARYVIGKADLPYLVGAIAQGVGSGEGLVERFRDELETTDKKGQPIIIPGSPEKRCLLRLSELSQAFKVGRRESSTLSETLRQAWDGDPIHIPNRGGNALTATGYSVGVVGDITPGALAKTLATGTESVDGYANRFLWAMTRRVRQLEFGGRLDKADPFAPKLAAMLDRAKGMGQVAWGHDAGACPKAKALWVRVYPALSASGDTVPHTDRAKPYALRLALIYALMDGERVIREPHLRAALAVWDYCRESARTLFGSGSPQMGFTLVPEPDPLWLRLLNAITSTPGVKRSALTTAFKNTDKADAITSALEGLRAKGLAYSVKGTGESGGAPAERWYPGAGDGGDGGEPSGEPEGDDGLHGGRGDWGSETVHPNPNPNPFAGLVVGEGEGGSKEVSKQVSNPPQPDREFLSGDSQKGSKQVNNPLPDPDGGDTYLLTSLLDTPTPVVRNPITENSSNPEPASIGIPIDEPVSTPTPLLPRVDHDAFPPAFLEPGTRLTKDHTGRTVRDCVNPTTVDVMGLTVDSFLEATWLWERREGGGFAFKGRGIANAGEVVDWVIANRKAILDRVKADAERDTADTSFLEALDGA